MILASRRGLPALPHVRAFMAGWWCCACSGASQPAPGLAPSPQLPPEQQQQQQQQQRLLTVALVGYPNAGKSELCNKLIGLKISGVSTKRNTTLEPRLGAFTSGAAQVVLYDTPGLVTRPEARHPVERLRSAWHVAAAADLILYIVDAEKQFKQRDHTLLRLAAQLAAGPSGAASLPFPWPRPDLVLLLNKRDKLPRDLAPSVLQQLEAHFAAAAPFRRVFAASALHGQGIGSVRQYLLHRAKPAPWLLPPGQCHVDTPGELAVELVREKLLRRLHKELPYKLAVVLLAARPCQLTGDAGPAGGGGPRERAAPAQGSGRDASALAIGTSPHQPPECEQQQQRQRQQQQQRQRQQQQQQQQRQQQRPPDGGRGGWHIHVEVLAENPRVKHIVIGPGGSIIQDYVTLPTQQELRDIFQTDVQLVVSVRVGGGAAAAAAAAAA